MDNFEYSIQISDRDWEDFYSTAEECGLMQVSLATAEELLLSDTEPEDATCSTATSKPKLIRVSLCPPATDQKEPQALQSASSPPRHSAYKWIGSSDDVLSGSEDEDELGSVARFLCQKEILLSKKLETEHKTSIPGSQIKDNYVANITIDTSRDNLLNESLVECMRSMASRRKHQSPSDGEDIQVEHTERMDPSVTSNEESEREPANDKPCNSLASNDPSTSNDQLLYSKDLPDFRKDNQSCMNVKGSSLPKFLPNDNIPGADDAIEDPEMCYLHSISTSPASLAKDGQATAGKENGDSVNSKSTLCRLKDPIFTNNLFQVHVMDCDTPDGNLHVITKAPGDSSAVQQNIPAVDLSKTKSNTEQIDTKVLLISQELSFDQYNLPITKGDNPVHSLLPGATIEHTRRSPPPTRRQSLPYRSASLTLPEMYDFFFDDVSELGIGTGSDMDSGSSSAKQQKNMATVDLSKTKSNIEELDTKISMSSHELDFDQYRLPIAEANNPKYSLRSDSTTEHPRRSPPTRRHSLPCGSASLTLPEMYDFFFDDVSEPGNAGTRTNAAGGDAKPEAAVYTPDMYEYFFVEEDERAIKRKDRRPEESSANAVQASSPASSPSVAASWPEACEFFFADGPQNRDKRGVLLSIPPSQAQRATSIVQSMVPQGMKAFTLQRTFHGRDGRLIPDNNFGASEESNVATTGSLVPYLSPSRSDACLVFLALASWAVKSSDLQSSDGWKTALVANIGAVSAIRYLRRRRKTWQGPSLEPVEEV